MFKKTTMAELTKIIEKITKKHITNLKNHYYNAFGRKAVMITFDERLGEYPNQFILKRFEEIEAQLLELIDKEATEEAFEMLSKQEDNHPLAKEYLKKYAEDISED